MVSGSWAELPSSGRWTVLYREVFYPVMSLVTQVPPSPFDLRTPTDKRQPIAPTTGYASIIEQAREEARSRGWQEPLGDVFYNQEFGIYGARFFRPGDEHGAAGVGPSVLYFDECLCSSLRRSLLEVFAPGNQAWCRTS